MAELLKNQFFQPAFIQKLGEKIKSTSSQFKVEPFEKDIFNSEWDSLELKGRMTHIALALGSHLPEEYERAIEVLSQIVHEFEGFNGMVFPEFTRLFGLDHWLVSMNALELFTQYSSGEFAIRHFILQEERKTMNKMLEWSQHSNHHVRRLSSEGCRPRLPWAMALPNFKKDPGLVLSILENLKADESEYVRKSVANNLNDITKDNPDSVIDLCKKWKTRDSRTALIIKHGLRSLVKAGNPMALKLLGFNAADVDIRNFKISPETLQLGEEVTLEFDIHNQGKGVANLHIDYIMHFKKANGTNTPKVFKLSTIKLEPGQKEKLSKAHKIYAITTRKYYPGKQIVEIQINGKALAKESFDLTI
ncbi:MAG: DNA alkylation repair protein [Bacteroidota bacterium]